MNKLRDWIAANAIKVVISLCGAVFAMGVFWGGFKFKFEDHEIRISANTSKIAKVELKFEEQIPKIQQSLARIEGALGVPRERRRDRDN